MKKKFLRYKQMKENKMKHAPVVNMEDHVIHIFYKPCIFSSPLHQIIYTLETLEVEKKSEFSEFEITEVADDADNFDFYSKMMIVTSLDQFKQLILIPKFSSKICKKNTKIVVFGYNDWDLDEQIMFKRLMSQQLTTHARNITNLRILLLHKNSNQIHPQNSREEGKLVYFDSEPVNFKN